MTCSPPLTTTEDATPNNRPLLTVKLDNDSKRKSDFVCADYQTRNKKARSTVILQETYRRRSAPPETAEASPRPARRPSLPSPTTTSTNNNLQAPRWHSQAYLLFLALKQHPAKCLPRTELIRAALELDEKISKEYKLPRLFRGKVRGSGFWIRMIILGCVRVCVCVGVMDTMSNTHLYATMDD